MLDRIALAGALIAVAAPPPARFAPAADHPYRYTTTETRTDGETRYRFTVQRRVTFHHDLTGWTALVAIEHFAAEAPPIMARAFEAGQAALSAHPAHYHLNADGMVTGIDDEAGLWRALASAVTGQAGSPPEPDAARRHAMLASTLEALVAGADAARVPGPPRPVRITARPLTGTAADLAGTEQVSRTAAGDLFLLTHAGVDPKSGTHLSVTLSRRIDPATGLVIEQDRVTETTRDGTAARVETYMHLAPVS